MKFIVCNEFICHYKSKFTDRKPESKTEKAMQEY